MIVIHQEYEGYQVDLVQMGELWQWNVYAAGFGMTRQVPAGGKRYETSEQALIAGRAAIDEVIGRAL